MVIPVIFDLSPDKEAPHLGEFLRAVAMQRNVNGPVVAQQEYFTSPSTFAERGRHEIKNDDLYSLYGRPTDDDMERILACPIPREMIDSLVKEKGSSSNAALFLYRERYLPLELWLEQTLKQVEDAMKEKPEAFLMFRQYPSFELVAKKHDMQIFYYDLAAFRLPTYRSVVYMDDIGFFMNVGLERRYEIFRDELRGNTVPLLSPKEILALMLMPRCMHLLSLYDSEAEYEVGVATQGTWFPPAMAYDNTSNLDVIVQGIKAFGADNVLLRTHPADLSRSGYDAFALAKDTSESAAQFIVRCKRIMSLTSNMNFEALLWGRDSYSLCRGLYQFKCLQNLHDKHAEPDAVFLNFVSFAFYVPFELLYDKEYLEWRVREKPSETELYRRHLAHYLKGAGIPEELLSLEGEVRLWKILEARGFDPYYNTIPLSKDSTDRNAELIEIMKEFTSLRGGELVRGYIEKYFKLVFDKERVLGLWRQCAAYAAELEKQLKEAAAGWEGAAAYAAELEKNLKEATAGWEGAAAYAAELEKNLKEATAGWESAAAYAAELEKNRKEATAGWEGAAAYAAELEKNLKEATAGWEGAAAYAAELEKNRKEATAGWEGAAAYATDLEKKLQETGVYSARLEEELQHLQKQWVVKVTRRFIHKKKTISSQSRDGERV